MAKVPEGVRKAKLEGYWSSLTASEVADLEKYFKKYFGEDLYSNSKLGNNRFEVMFSLIQAFKTMSNLKAAQRAIDYVEKNKIDTSKVETKHFFYTTAIDVLYKPTKPDCNMPEKAKEYCRRDIELVQKNEAKMKAVGGGVMPFIPSFKTLAIILEKEGNFAEAISVCNLAMSYGLTDKTSGGYIERRQKLLKKLERGSK